MEFEEENESSNELEEEEALIMQQRAPKLVWSNEAAKDRLIGKMLRLVSQFVFFVNDENTLEDNTTNKVQYIRGNRAVIHTNEFLK